MPELGLFSFIGIALTGLLVGFLSGLFGVGGGFLMTPIMRVVFGIPYYIAIGSDLAVIAVTSMFGSWKHFKMKHVNLSLGLSVLLGTFPGVEIGARILTYLKEKSSIETAAPGIPVIDLVLNICYIVLLASAGAIMLVEYIKWDREKRTSLDLSKYDLKVCAGTGKLLDHKHRINVFQLSGVGFCIGILQGLMGVGGGFILVPILIRFFRIPAAVVIGTSLFIVALSSVFGSVSHFLKGNVSLMIVLLLLSGSVIGSYLGTRLTSSLRGKKIRLYFIYLIALAVILIGWKFITQLF